MASYQPMSFHQVLASGPGLQKNGVPQGQPATFTVDTRKAGKAPLKIYGEDVNGKPIDIKVKDNGDGTYDCQYKPKEPIKHTVIVTFGGCNVPNSPFRVSQHWKYRIYRYKMLSSMSFLVFFVQIMLCNKNSNSYFLMEYKI